MPNVAAEVGHFASVVAISPTNVWAVGPFVANGKTRLAAHFDGTSWKVTPTPADALVSQLVSVAAVPGTNRVWAVGWVNDQVSGLDHPLALQWNGSAWRKSSAANGISGVLNGVTVLPSGETWAVGTQTLSNGQTGQHSHLLTERYGSQGWKVVPTPPDPFSEDGLQGVSGSARGGVWAVGWGQTPNDPFRAITEHWNGTEWHRVRNPGSAGGNTGALFGVSATSRNDVWAVGESDSLAMHWDGSFWSESVLPSVSGGRLTGIDTLPSGSTFAVGYQETSSHAIIEHWKGSRWSATTGPIGVVSQLFGVSATSNRDVWAVGTDSFKPLVEHRGCS